MKRPRRWLRIWALVQLLALLVAGSAAAESNVLALPACLSEITEEAFSGMVSFKRTVVPESVTRIEKRAFADTSLEEITLPEGVVYIAEDAFAGAPLATIIAAEGSYAWDWALAHGIEARTAASGETDDPGDEETPEVPGTTEGAETGSTPELGESLLNAAKIEALILKGESVLGSRYRYAAMGPTYFDCSGFVCYCYASVGVTLPHNSGQISKLTQYTKITKLTDFKRGDIVVFDFSHDTPKSADHVAIYLGNGYIIEASSSAGCVRTKKVAGNTYYKKHVLCGIRVFD